jgi:hypothetical protein
MFIDLITYIECDGKLDTNKNLETVDLYYKTVYKYALNFNGLCFYWALHNTKYN